MTQTPFTNTTTLCPWAGPLSRTVFTTDAIPTPPGRATASARQMAQVATVRASLAGWGLVALGTLPGVVNSAVGAFGGPSLPVPPAGTLLVVAVMGMVVVFLGSWAGSMVAASRHVRRYSRRGLLDGGPEWMIERSPGLAGQAPPITPQVIRSLSAAQVLRACDSLAEVEDTFHEAEVLVCSFRHGGEVDPQVRGAARWRSTREDVDGIAGSLARVVWGAEVALDHQGELSREQFEALVHPWVSAFGPERSPSA